MLSFRQFHFLNESLRSASQYFFNKHYEEIKKDRKIVDGSDEDQHLYEHWVGVFEQLASYDPTPQKKYLDWIVRKFSGIPQEFEGVIKNFDRIKNHPDLKKKDINSYDSLEELEQEIERIELSIMSKSGKGSYGISGLKEGEDYKTVYRDNNWIIFQPLNFQASRKIGSNTEWCTVAADYRWNEYTKTANLYYCIRNDGEKYAIRALYDGNLEVWNKEDEQLGPVDFFDEIMKINFIQVSNIFKKPSLEQAFVNELELVWSKGWNGYIAGDVDISKVKDMVGDRIPVNIVKAESFDFYKVGVKTLENCPKEVQYYFSCADTRIESLIGAPIKCGSFDCSNTVITSLEGGPRDVTDKYTAQGTNITDLIGMPAGPIKKVRVDMNDNLVSLEGSPKIVTGRFDCSYCNLRSLEGCPDEVGELDASSNPLETLEFLPKKMGAIILLNCFDNLHEDTLLFSELKQTWEKHFMKETSENEKSTVVIPNFVRFNIDNNLTFKDIYYKFVATDRDLDKNLDLKGTIITLINDKMGNDNTIVKL